MANTPVTAERFYHAEPSKVWTALTDVREMKKWYFDVQNFSLTPGTEFYFDAGPEHKSYRHLCKVLEVVPEKRLSYSWRYEGYDGDTVVTWFLKPEGNGTRLKLTHSGLETFPASNPDFARSNFEAGWAGFFNEVLAKYLEG